MFFYFCRDAGLSFTQFYQDDGGVALFSPHACMQTGEGAIFRILIAALFFSLTKRLLDKFNNTSSHLRMDGGNQRTVESATSLPKLSAEQIRCQHLHRYCLLVVSDIAGPIYFFLWIFIFFFSNRKGLLCVLIGG